MKIRAAAAALIFCGKGTGRLDNPEKIAYTFLRISKDLDGKEYMPLRFREEPVGERLSGWVWKVVPESQR